MALTLVQLRLKIREMIRDFYDVDTVDTGGINSSSETLPVSNLNRYNIGDVLTIESEQVIVRSLDSDTDTLTVTRAFRLSTAAAHLAGVTIVIHPEFTDRALNQSINSAIADSYPDIWLEVVNETLTTAAAREYTIPSGFTLIRRIQVEDSNGFYHENRDWELIGTKIKFNRDFADFGMTIRVIGQTYQAQLASDATSLDIADEQAEFILFKGAVLALEMRLGHRLKSTEYSAAVNDRAGQPLEMIQMYRYLQNESEIIKRRERKEQMPSYAMRPVR